MDDDDFRDLIALVEGELREIGAGGIADPRHYLTDPDDGGERRLLDPQKHLVELLAAFERKLAVEDRGVFVAALERINMTLRDGGIQGAVLELASEEDRKTRVLDLSRAPDLSELRQETLSLIGNLIESHLPPRSLA